jgi:NAD(P)-dependent dehydrogenase (short-subunit alcohol dehydrogenase family)
MGKEIMPELAGKTAFVTGGASGIGLALGRAFVEEGMKVMLADIETDVLAKAVNGLDGPGRVRGVTCDVADPSSVERAAEATYEAFGHVHVVCNNAGIGARGGIDNISLENWRWVFDVNVMGVLHGIRTFLPHIRSHGEGGHFVNTASIAGISARQYFNPYGASKHAVVSMSEGLAAQLEPLGIGVSVLCPAFVRTHIMESERNRPARYGPKQSIEAGSQAAALRAQMTAGVEAGIEPSTVAARVVAAIRENELYVFSHPGMRAMVEKRLNAILAAMDKVGA